jgi:hypothetical protein
MSRKIIPPEGMWWCAKHISFLPVDRFSAGQIQRRASLCLDCMRTRRHEPKELYQSVKGQAKIRNIPFTLNAEEFSQLVSRPCAYGTSTHVGLDRLDNTLGYTNGNCVACCYKHNLIKGQWFSFDDMLRIVALFPSARECGDRLCRL